MGAATVLAISLILGALSGVAAESDVVNERIPVPGRALERHWGIDCERLVDRYNREAAVRFDAAGEETLSNMIREATLCSFVYNVHAQGAPTESCPDYGAMSAVLQALRSMREAGSAPEEWTVQEVHCEVHRVESTSP